MTTGVVPELAAVIIARDEEELIARSIQSVLHATSGFPGCEVVMVDSHSTDRTAEVARTFPVRVVRIRQGVRTSPAMGRLIGERLTRSEFVLFVDGDTEIEGHWVREAVELMRERPDVGGVGGKLRDIYYREGIAVGENPDGFRVPDHIVDADQLGGNALYRRAALEATGSFNPYVFSNEEAELAERIRQAGYAVVRIPELVGTHHTLPPGTVGELRRRLRENLIIGYGQVLRLSLSNGLFWVHARQMKRYLQFAAVVFLGLMAAAASLVHADSRYFLSWLGACAVLIGVLALRSRSVRKPFVLILGWAFWIIPMLIGFLQRPRDPSRFSLNDVVARDETC